VGVLFALRELAGRLQSKDSISLQIGRCYGDMDIQDGEALLSVRIRDRWYSYQVTDDEWEHPSEMIEFVLADIEQQQARRTDDTEEAPVD
jgi:hypothetical protein